MVVDVVDEDGAAGVVVVVVVAGELSMCEWYVCVISLYLSLASVRSFVFEKKKKNGRSTTTKKEINIIKYSFITDRDSVTL